MPHRADHRDRAFGDGADHLLLVEGPEILDTAAAARHDDQIGAGDGAARRDVRKAPHRRRHLRRRALALHQHRPHQHMAGKAVS